MRPEDVYELTYVGEPRISLDGSRVAYIVTSLDRDSNEYRAAVWVAPLDGSAEPPRFTSGERPAGARPGARTDGDSEAANHACSRDGGCILFTGLRSERWDTELITRLYGVDTDSVEPQQLTGDEGSYETPSFSPDGSRIAYAFV